MRYGEVGHQGLITDIIDRARAFDLLIDIRFRGDKYSAATRFVTADQRTQVRASLDEFIHSYHLTTHPVIIDPERFEETLSQEVDRIGSLIAARVFQKRVSD